MDDKTKLGSFLLLAFSMAYLYASLQIPPDTAWPGDPMSSRTLPLGLAIASIAMAILQILMPGRDSTTSSVREAIAGFRWRPAALLIFGMLGFSLLLRPLGFIGATILFLFAGFWILGERRWALSLGISLTVAFFMWFFLTQVFGLYLDPGTLLAGWRGARDA